mmetsp:Transcript_28719/g.71654  ORF Transcript_28719/g.71654 Transcript_28719/m.71654 type:complete len:324 (+) Transcript_28719:552-1523(+)
MSSLAHRPSLMISSHQCPKPQDHTESRAKKQNSRPDPHRSLGSVGRWLCGLGDLSLPALDDLLRHVGRDGHVLGHLHGEGRPPLRQRPQHRCVAKHLGERHFCGDLFDVALQVFHLADLPPPAVQVAHDVAHVLAGSRHINLHDGLEQLRGALLGGLLESHRAGDLEGHLVAVDVVIAAVEESDAHVDQGVAGDDAVLHLLGDAALDGRDVLLGHHTPHNGVLELIARTRLKRLDLDPDITIHTAATGLLDIPALSLRLFGECFPIGDLWGARDTLDLELTLEPVDDDLEMQLAHAADDRLARLLVRGDPERGVFSRELAEGR